MSTPGTTPRQQVAAQILTDRPGWIVVPYPFTPASVAPARPVVTVIRSDLSPGSRLTGLTHELQINLYGAGTVGAKTEDSLDDFLDEIMLSLERVGGFKFDKASRMTYRDETLAGWQITGSVQSANVYRQAVQNERS